MASQQDVAAPDVKKASKNKPPLWRRNQIKAQLMSAGPSAVSSMGAQDAAWAQTRMRNDAAFYAQWAPAPFAGSQAAPVSVHSSPVLPAMPQSQPATIVEPTSSTQAPSAPTPMASTVQAPLEIVRQSKAALYNGAAPTHTSASLQARINNRPVSPPITVKKPQAESRRSVSPELDPAQQSSRASSVARPQSVVVIGSSPAHSSSGCFDSNDYNDYDMGFNNDIPEPANEAPLMSSHQLSDLDEFRMKKQVLLILQGELRQSSQQTMRYGDVVRMLSEQHVGPVHGTDFAQVVKALGVEGCIEVEGEGRSLHIRYLGDGTPIKPAFANGHSKFEAGDYADDNFIPDFDDEPAGQCPLVDENPERKAEEKQAKEKQAKEKQAEEKASTGAHFAYLADRTRATLHGLYPKAVQQRWQGDPIPTAMVLRDIINTHFGGRDQAASDLTRVCTVWRPDHITSVGIQCSDLLSMADGEWLEHDAVPMMLRINFPNADGIDGNAQLVDPHTVSDIFNVLNPTKPHAEEGFVLVPDDALAAFPCPFKLNSACREIVSVISVGSAHWFAFAANDQGVVRVYDSKGGYTSDFALRFQQMMDWACGQDDVDPSWEVNLGKWQVRWEQSLYRQRNGLDCGVHAIQNAIDLMRTQRVQPFHDAAYLRYRYVVRLEAVLNGDELQWGAVDNLAADMRSRQPSQVLAASHQRGLPRKEPTAAAALTSSSHAGTSMPHALGGAIDLAAIDRAMAVDNSADLEEQAVVDDASEGSHYVDKGTDAGFDPMIVPEMPADATFSAQTVDLPSVRLSVSYRQALVSILAAGPPEGLSWEEIRKRYEAISAHLGRPMSASWRDNIKTACREGVLLFAEDPDTGNVVALKGRTLDDDMCSASAWYGPDAWRCVDRKPEVSDDIDTRPDLIILPTRMSKIRPGLEEKSIFSPGAFLEGSAQRFFEYYLKVHWGTRDEPVCVADADGLLAATGPAYHVYSFVRSSRCLALEMANGHRSDSDNQVIDILKVLQTFSERTNQPKAKVHWLVCGVDAWTTNNAS